MIKRDIDNLLIKLSQSLDISTTEFKNAETSYNYVGKYLGEGRYTGIEQDCTIPVYPQGSMKLGTVVRPIKDGKESDFDIDLVFELPTSTARTTPNILKSEVGNRLRANGRFSNKLEESRRCWTISYNNFHIDVLPCVKESEFSDVIKISDKRSTWKESNPKGYAKWFKKRSDLSEERMVSLANAMDSRANRGNVKIEEVHKFIRRSVLQQVVQLMKRHRDVRFIGKDDKPISMIITTLAAAFYEGELSIYEALCTIAKKMAKLDYWLDMSSLQYYKELQSNSVRALSNSMDENPSITITRNADGLWFLPNPVDPNENFADRWHENNNAKANAFFEWVKAFQIDIKNLFDFASQKRGLKYITENLIGSKWGYDASQRTAIYLAEEMKNTSSYFTGVGVAPVIGSTYKSIPKNTFYGE